MDINLVIGGTLSLTSTGDLAMVNGPMRGQQRVLRRLLTNPGDYIWELDYGAGLPGQIGHLADIFLLNSLVQSQIFEEAAVSQSPAPVVTTNAITNGMQVHILYTDSGTNQQQALAFDMSDV